MQGHYRDDLETTVIQTQCSECDRPITITFDRELNFQVDPPEANPQIFVPLVDFDTLEAPNIIEDF